MNGIQASQHISSRIREKPSETPTPHSFACPRRASNHTSDQSSGSEHQQWATTTSNRRHFVSIFPVWTSRQLVGRSNWVFLLHPICARPASKFTGALWKSLQITIWRADHSFWSRGKILFYICKRPRSSASVRHKSLSWNIHALPAEREGKLQWWFIDGAHGRSPNDGTIWL